MNTSSLSAAQISLILSTLTPMAEGLYYFLPDKCWMKEKTIAKALKTHTRVISQAKRELGEAKLISIIVNEQNNSNKIKKIHTIVKVLPCDMLPIPEEYQWLLRAREEVLSPNNQTTIDKTVLTPSSSIDDNSTVTPKGSPLGISTVQMNWELLKKYSSSEINKMSKIEQVELYMEVGFLVLPTNYPIFRATGEVYCSCKNEYCHAVGKHPSLKKYKTLTPETYKKRRSYFLRRFKQDKNLNVGFKLCGYSIVDVDYNHEGASSLAYLQDEFPGLDETLTVASANGEHLYSSSVGFNQSVGLIGKGLDIRSDKTSGFIVAPCSVHKSGKQYQWKSISDLQPIPTEWFKADNEIKKRNKRTTSMRVLKDVKIPHSIDSDYSIPEGERNATLFKFASRERGRGADESYINDVISTINQTYCEQPLSEAELRSIARSAYRFSTNAEKFRTQAA